MSLHEITEKCKSAVESERVFLAFAIILVGIGSFGLGRLSKIEAGRQAVSIEAPTEVASAINAENSASNGAGALFASSTDSSYSDGQVVASKSGTKYHFPWCAGAKSISEQNKIYFPSSAAARAAGYAPAANCKGLK